MLDLRIPIWAYYVFSAVDCSVRGTHDKELALRYAERDGYEVVDAATGEALTPGCRWPIVELAKEF